MSDILVTGAAGWLGTALCRALAGGLPEVPDLLAPERRAIRCLVRTAEEAELVRKILPSARIVVGDVGEAESLEALFAELLPGASVYHCAGVIHPGRVADFYRVNTRGTENVLEAAIAKQAGRFIYVSSNSPIGCNPLPSHRFDESAPYHPYMNYGRSKKLAEEAVLAAGQAGRIATVIIRPPWFYGPGQPPRQSEFFKMIRSGRAPLVGSGENRRSMAYVDNIVQGLLLAERRPAACGQIYWIADKEPYPMKNIIETIGTVLEEDFGLAVKRGVTRLPGFMSAIAFGVDACVQALGFYHTKIHVLSEMNKTIACDIGKAERELGYAPHISLREGMRRSVKDLLDRGESLT